jgi:hypothetical protein
MVFFRVIEVEEISGIKTNYERGVGMWNIADRQGG